jgi:hypothetical protein
MLWATKTSRRENALWDALSFVTSPRRFAAWSISRLNDAADFRYQEFCSLLGLHASGTDATMQWTVCSTANMPEDPAPPTPANEIVPRTHGECEPATCWNMLNMLNMLKIAL